MRLFEGFELQTRPLADGDIRLRVGGSGPPLILLHGNPQTHLMWHAVAAELARTRTVVCPDLRGYGGSLKPPASADHAAYSKHAMAADVAEIATQLGFERFQLVGHDRGGRVGHRLALDYPERVERLAVLDIIPTLEHFERTDMSFAMGYYHWFWLAQPHPFPENLISAAPEEWFFSHTAREPKERDFFHPEALEDYLAAVRDPAMIRGMCEDYRAAAGIDLEHDRNSRAAGERIACPLLVLWGSEGKVGEWYDLMSIWRDYCDAKVSGGPVRSGHYLAEESPREVLSYLLDFLG